MIQWAAVTVNQNPQIAAIVLAAGGSARMGKLKQLLPIEGQPMVRRLAAAACQAGLDQVVAVVGARAEEVQQALSGLPLELVVNQDWPLGLSTSVQAGIRALRPEVQAALMVLADQPGLTPDLIRSLADRYRETGAPLVVPRFQGRRGNPVLVARPLFAELAAVEGDRGGRVLLARHETELEWVDVEDPALVLDVDTPEDYETLDTKADRS